MVDQIVYRVETFQPDGLCAARYDRVPLLEVVRTAPDRPDIARGLLPPDVERLAPGYRIRVSMAGRRIPLDCGSAGFEMRPKGFRRYAGRRRTAAAVRGDAVPGIHGCSPCSKASSSRLSCRRP